MRHTLIQAIYSLHVFNSKEELLYRSEPIPDDELPARLKNLKEILNKQAYSSRLKLMNLSTGEYEQKPI